MGEEITSKTEEKTTVSRPTQEVKTEPPQQVYKKKKAIFRSYQIVWYILAVIEILLGFRFVLKAVGANSFSGFTNFVYTISNPLATPFSDILATTVYGNSVFEWSTLIAAAVYALIAYGIVYLLQLIKPVTPREVSEEVDNP